MKKMDVFILKKFQKMADFLQIVFGITCFSLGRYLIIAWAVVDVFVHCIEAGDRGIMVNISPFIVVPLILCVSQIFYINQAEQEHRKTPTCRNFLELRFEIIRLMLVFLFVTGIIDVIFNSPTSEPKEFAEHYVSKFSFIATTIWLLGLYFASCTPLPPQKSKLKKLMEKLATGLLESKTQPV